MLWRALGHVTDGLYVDIGAQHPRIDSISRAFHERGWHGVHVEPVPAFAEMVRKDRPGDTVLQIALGEQAGTLALNVFPDTGLSTAIDDYAERHRSERGYATEVIQVPLLPMHAALSFLDDKPVHWLKIDVEGFEEQVLRGWDSKRLRPWVLVIEATIPNSRETDHEKWEHLVLAGGYRFVYFDGLNRFYIAPEHPELEAAFAAPPNIFDAVEVSGLASWGLCNVAVAEVQGQVRQLEQQVAELDEELKRCRDKLSLHEIEDADTKARAFESRVAALFEETSRAAIARDQALQAQAQAQEQLAAEQQRVRALEAECAAAQKSAEELKHKSHYWWQTAEELRLDAGSARNELSVVYGSRSWRVSAPLRKLSLHARPLRRFVGRAARWGLRQPSRVLRVISGGRFGTAAPAPGDSPVVVMAPNPAAPAVTRRLSSRASRLYVELKETVEKGHK